jgi:dihydrofolate synthase/folylpolyglutamate synthase
MGELLDDYSDALGYLCRRINYETATSVPYRDREMNLPRMRWLLDQLGNPHNRLPIVHIAGTKGKGSTAAMVSSILTAAGYRVGTYTSPHLVDLEERFAVDGRPCSRLELVGLVNEVRETLSRLTARDARWRDDELTFFDITTAIGLIHFVRRKVDVAVIEVGMGGRLDSTNVCQPVLSVITSIGLDHTRQLGSTLSAIAGEKAGIIKPGVPVVSGAVEPEAAQVIEEVAGQRGCPLYLRGRDFDVSYDPATPGLPGTVSYWEERTLRGWRLGPARMGMLGRHQAANAGVSLATLSLLRGLGWMIDDEDCLHGLATAVCPARIEVLGRRPTVIVDTAHNVDSIRALMTTINESCRGSPRVLIFAVSRDKDVAELLRLLLPGFDHVILTRYIGNPRGLPVTELNEIANHVASETGRRPLPMHVADTPWDAWNRWQSFATPESLLCITGSFFLAAELEQAMANRHLSGSLPV